MKKLKFCFPLLLILLLSACIGQTEINHTLIIDMIGLEKVDQQYRLMLYSYKENSGNEKMMEGTGYTIEEAIQNIEESKNKKLFLLQANTLVVGQSIFEENLNPVFEDLNHAKYYNINMNVYGAENVKDIFSSDEIQNINGNKYNKIIRQEKQQGSHKNLIDYLKLYYNEQRAYSLPLIGFAKDTGLDVVNVGGAFIENGKKTGVLSKEDCRNLQILEGDFNNQIVTLGEDEKTSVLIDKVGKKVKLDGEKENLILTIEGQFTDDKNKWDNRVFAEKINKQLENTVKKIDSLHEKTGNIQVIFKEDN